MATKNLLLICTLPRDRREIEQLGLNKKYRIFYHHLDKRWPKAIYWKGFPISQDFDPEKEIEYLVQFCLKNNIHGVMSSQDYPGNVINSMVAKKLGFTAPTPKATLICQNKYLCRLAEKASIPNETSLFFLNTNVTLRELSEHFPLFVKPIKARFSAFAEKVLNKPQLFKALKSACPPASLIKQFNWFLDENNLPPQHLNEVLIEKNLEGKQCTLEGFFFNGKIHFLGVTDSHFMDNQTSFSKFIFPSTLPKSALLTMEKTAEIFLRFIGFDNGMFNVEFFYDPTNNSIKIIEINPRIASQFADLYEKVLGINGYEIMANIAAGEKPNLKDAQGKYKIACSFVLRRKTDALVVKIPLESELKQFYAHFPDGRFQLFATKGKQLSKRLQDGKSFIYGLIHIGAQSKEELSEKLKIARQILKFDLKPI